MKPYQSEPQNQWQLAEEIREQHARRKAFIAIADMNVSAALAWIEIGRQTGDPRRQRRAVRCLADAADCYGKAGMGRKRAATERLMGRAVRAWQRHDESEGFR